MRKLFVKHLSLLLETKMNGRVTFAKTSSHTKKCFQALVTSISYHKILFQIILSHRRKESFWCGVLHHLLEVTTGLKLEFNANLSAFTGITYISFWCHFKEEIICCSRFNNSIIWQTKHVDQKVFKFAHENVFTANPILEHQQCALRRLVCLWAKNVVALSLLLLLALSSK